MVRIPNIKIPSVRVGSLSPTSNIGTGGATPAPPTPITYLTQWRIAGNSEVHGNEIWSCGEYNPIDGKWHIRILPEGYGVVDIALTEPLRMVNDVADTIEFPSSVEGKALVTRPLRSADMGNYNYQIREDLSTFLYMTSVPDKAFGRYNILSDTYKVTNVISARNMDDMEIMGNESNIYIYVRDMRYTTATEIKESLRGVELIYELETPTTELVDAPQIAEAESYSMVISQGGKAVEWSSFDTDSE